MDWKRGPPGRGLHFHSYFFRSRLVGLHTVSGAQVMYRVYRRHIAKNRSHLGLSISTRSWTGSGRDNFYDFYIFHIKSTPTDRGPQEESRCSSLLLLHFQVNNSLLPRPKPLSSEFILNAIDCSKYKQSVFIL